MAKTENQLQNQIASYLAACGYIVHRMQSGKVKVKGGWMQLCPEGTPDLMAVGKKGRIIWIEVKTTTGSLSDKQKEHIAELIFRGQEVHIIRSIKQLEAVLF